MTHPTDVLLRVVPDAERIEALWMLFAAEPEPTRRDRVAATARAAAAGTVSCEHLLETWHAGQRTGVIWGQPLAGRNANLWGPTTLAGEPESTADRLLEALHQRLAAAGVSLVQALPSPAAPEIESLRRHAYLQAASLLYFLCSAEHFPPDGESSPLSFVPFADADDDRLAAVIDATYVGTLDAPALDGTRATRDVIAGYQGTGVFSPDRWFLVRHDGEDVGCLLLTDHPDLQVWELIYMGLVPGARRQGWGNQLVRFAQWQTRQAGRHALLVSVDAANHPAVITYQRAGFRQVEHRQVWVKKLTEIR